LFVVSRREDQGVEDGRTGGGEREKERKKTIVLVVVVVFGKEQNEQKRERESERECTRGRTGRRRCSVTVCGRTGRSVVVVFKERKERNESQKVEVAMRRVFAKP
jgi:hypothetical protein